MAKVFRIITLFIFIITSHAFANGVCSDIFQSKQETSWVIGNKNYFMALRSNANHYWSWFRFSAEKYLSPKLLTQGIVIGDIHFNNISIIKGIKKIFLGVVDSDDGGRGPLVGDFIQYAVRVEASPSRVALKGLTQEYLKGLQSTEIELPPFLLRVISENENAKKFKAQQEKRLYSYVDPNTNKLRNSGVDFVSIKKSPIVVQEKWNRDKENIEIQLADFKIIDKAYYAKETGGSRGLTRFFLYVKQKKQKSILQLKELGVPAVSIISIQKSDAERIMDIEFNYNDNQTEFVTVVEGQNTNYIATRKVKLDFDASSLSKKELDEYALFLARWVGYKQAQQAEAQPLVKYISQNQEKAAGQIMSAVEAYIQESKMTFDHSER